MTFQEAENACKRLSEINLAIWNTYDRHAKKALKADFKEAACAIVKEGFKIKHRVIDGTPKFWPIANNNASRLAIVNNRPDDVHIHGDCTTRCISLCTGIDYKVIQREQHKNAAMLNCSWKNNIAWSLSLTSRGFAKICFSKKVTRKTLIKILSLCPETNDIIASHSARHIAAIDMKEKKVLDIFDSVGGRVDYIYVPMCKKQIYADALASIAFSI